MKNRFLKKLSLFLTTVMLATSSLANVQTVAFADVVAEGSESSEAGSETSEEESETQKESEQEKESESEEQPTESEKPEEKPEEPHLTHTYGEPEWIWAKSETGYTAVARFQCTGCEEKVDRETKVTSTFKKGDCKTPSITTYTAETDFEGKHYAGAKAVTGELGDHNPVIDPAVAPTDCTLGDGLTEGSHCSICGTVLKEQKAIPKAEHQFELINHLDPDCTNAGFDVYKCTVCGVEDMINYVELGHDFVDGTCTNCGEAENFAILVSGEPQYLTITSGQTIHVEAVSDDPSVVDCRVMTEEIHNGTHETDIGLFGQTEGKTKIRIYIEGELFSVWTFACDTFCQDDINLHLSDSVEVSQLYYLQKFDLYTNNVDTDFEFDVQRHEWNRVVNGAEASTTVYEYTLLCTPQKAGLQEIPVYAKNAGLLGTVTVNVEDHTFDQNHYCLVCMQEDPAFIEEFIAKGLPVPQNVKAVNGGKGVELTWDAIDHVHGYQIYRDGEPLADPIGENCYVDKNVSYGEKHEYTIVSLRYKNGEEVIYSEKSEQVSIEVKQLAMIDTIQNSASGIRLSWIPVNGADGYGVFKRTKNADGKYVYKWIKNFAPKTTAYNDTNVKVGEKSYYLVKYFVRDAEGKAVWSAPSKVRASVRITPPTLGTVKNVKDGLTVTWNKVAAAEKYQILRKAAGESGYSVIGYSKTTSYADKTAVSGVKYAYTVKALISYDGVWYKSACDNAGKVTYHIAPVTISVARKSATSMTVSWEPIKAAAGYEIQYSRYTDFTFDKIVTVANAAAASRVIDELRNGQTYYVHVRSYLIGSNGAKIYSDWGNTAIMK